MQAFKRQLGAEVGVQLNPLVDNSDGTASGNSDQVFAMPLVSTRGRIDRPFLVNRSNFKTLLGKGIGEPYSQLSEALVNGAYQCVVQRMVAEDARIDWMVQPLTGEMVVKTEAEKDALNGAFLFAVKNLDCYEDGLKVKFDYKDSEGELIILDPVTGDKLAGYKGSLDSESVNDYGESDYLPNVVSSRTDSIVFEFGNIQASVVDPNANFAGSIATANPVISFHKGTQSVYAVPVLEKARDRLLRAKPDFQYISIGGSKSPALIYQMSLLAKEANKQLRIDIDGSLTPAEAIVFMKQLNQDEMLTHFFWMPIKSNDPSGKLGSYYMGGATLNIAYACKRNASKNAKGFARKNAPIGGVKYPISRIGMVQTYTPTDQELNDLANAKINPVLWEVYNGGGKFVFVDVLTSAKTKVSYRKLISTADMSTDLDDRITRKGKELLISPMSEAVYEMKNYLQTLFEDAQTSNWLVPSQFITGGGAFSYEVFPAQEGGQDSADKMIVNYTLRYDGVVRQEFFTQTISR